MWGSPSSTRRRPAFQSLSCAESWTFQNQVPLLGESALSRTMQLRIASCTFISKASVAKSRRTYGGPRLTDELRDKGIAAGRHCIARLMRESHLRAKKPRRFKKTNDSGHTLPIAALSRQTMPIVDNWRHMELCRA